MKKRSIVKINQQKCIGCGLCINACNEGALKLINGKATLISDSYCDGLGNCLPACPVEAIIIEEREADSFDKEAATKNKESSRKENLISYEVPKSQLRQWPVQMKLVPVNAPYFNNADLLIAADCTAFSYGNFHNDFMHKKVTVIGCPKLDNTNYADKLAEILLNNNINSITVLRMEVPCCGGIVNIVKQALAISQKFIPWSIVTISTEGEIIDGNNNNIVRACNSSSCLR